MGLFSSYLWYRHGQKKAERRRALEDHADDSVCNNCGHTRRQHSNTGQCPRYE